MSGFSYKNLLLQIIHGAVIIGTLAFLFYDVLNQNLIDYLKANESILLALFLFSSFIIGVIIDFVADILESFAIRFFIKPPIFYLLTTERHLGITLAHNEYILFKLCQIASKFDKDKKDVSCYYKEFKTGKNKKIINYILQVAKNKAFRVCKDYQKEQIDSFFVLYIFSRNISLSLLISAVVVFIYSNISIAIILMAIVLFTVTSSYRFYLYYSRILLGVTVTKENSVR